MNSTVERLEGNKAKLTITASAKEVDAAIGKAYAEAAGKYRIPGFRKGKAPRPVIDNYVGRPIILNDALQTFVNDSYKRAIEENDLRPMDAPEIEELEEPTPGQDYTFSAELELRPELTLSSVDDLKIEVSPAAVSDAEIDEQVDASRERFATLEAVEDRGVEPGDFVLLSFVGTIGGESYEGNTVDKYLYEMGKGLMPKEFDEALLGHKPAEKVEVEFEIPETSQVPDYIGKTAHFDVDIHEIKAKVLPEVSDETAQTISGFDTMDEYRGDLRQKMEQAKRIHHGQEVERESRKALAGRLEGEIPEPMIEERTGAITRDFINGLEERGMSLEQYSYAVGMDAEQLEKDMRDRAVESLQEELALEALFRREGMNVTEDDITRELEELSGPGEGARRFGENLRAAGTMPLLVDQIKHKQAVMWLLDHVEVIEREPKAAESEPEAEAKPKKRARKSAKKESAPAAEPNEKEE